MSCRSFSALSALAAYKQGAKAVYLNGGAITNNVTGLPDIALISRRDVRNSGACLPGGSRAHHLRRRYRFGEAWNTARTVIEMERAGLAGIHLEDQVSPKRCGHLDGKAVIPTDHMLTKSELLWSPSPT
ncbi:MAG: hypothetical protein R2688_05940 [Fimbriimonadaceae bacterium]